MNASTTDLEGREGDAEDLKAEIGALKTRLGHARADRELLTDALDHIMRTCRGSRTQTRRLRWIEQRCKSAINGDDKWRSARIPVNDPIVDRLRSLLRMIFPIVARELNALVDNYTTPSDQDTLSLPALLETIEERSVYEDCKVMRQFLLDTRRAVPEINIEELKKGGEWIELV